jgi:putative Holliday junction resolvase
MEFPFLSFDLGKKRIGVALVNRSRLITPLPTLWVQGPFDRYWEQHLTSLLETYAPKGLLVGLPIQPNGKPSEQTRWVEEIIVRMRQWTTVPIDTINELLTSVEAHERLSELGLPRKKHQAYVDSVAAMILAESYCNKRNP